MERDKEGDGFVRLRWEETKEGDTVGGACLTIEIGAEFPIGIISGCPIRERRFESGYRESETRGISRIRQSMSGLIENDRLGERVDNQEVTRR